MNKEDFTSSDSLINVWGVEHHTRRRNSFTHTQQNRVTLETAKKKTTDGEVRWRRAKDREKLKLLADETQEGLWPSVHEMTGRVNLG